MNPFQSLGYLALLPRILKTLTNLEKFIMASVAELNTKLNELQTTIADERTQVGTLITTIEQLKAALAEAEVEVDLSAEIAAVDAAIAGVKNIAPDEVAPVEPAEPVA
ncbi:MAG: hypothetical protein KME42_14150 [Tildeniella nuda ZEHNDER 1965/U140]|jgi:chromosome segregation ATPase|nr:hypothetical protein [Tildeniella nuda ZEHNDER 1965/U140]